MMKTKILFSVITLFLLIGVLECEKKILFQKKRPWRLSSKIFQILMIAVDLW